MSPWMQLVFVRLIDLYVLSAVLLAVSLIAMRWWLRSPALRMAWSWGATGGLVILVLAALVPAGWRLAPAQWLAQWRVANEIAEAAAPPVVPMETAELPAVTAPPVVRLEPLATNADESKPIPPQLAWQAAQVALLSAWGASAGIVVLWLMVGSLRARRIKRRSQAAPNWAMAELKQCAAKKSPQLLVASDLVTAVAMGTWKPAILLPDCDVRKDNQPAARAAIRHEWAHIAAGDLWLHAAQRWLAVVLFANPLYWLFRRQTRFDQELLADAAAASDDPLAYAEVLLTWAKQRTRGGLLPAISNTMWAADACGLAMWREPSSLQRRIEMLVKQPTSPAQRSVRWRPALVAAVLLFGLALTAITTNSQEPGSSDPGPAEVINVNVHGPIRTIYGQDTGGKRLVVISESPERLTIRVHEAVRGPDLESTYSVRNAGELQKRHQEAFQLYQRFTSAVEASQLKSTRATTRATTGDGAMGAPSTRIPLPPVNPVLTANTDYVFLIDSTIGEINHGALNQAEVSLGEIVQEELAGECKLEGNLIFALCSPKDAANLVARLKEYKSFDTLSHPRMVTQDKQAGQIQVGSEIPILKSTRVVNGVPEKEVSYSFEGINLHVTPSYLKLPDAKPDDGEQFGLEVKAELSKRQSLPKDAPEDAVPGLDRRALQLKVTMEPKQLLIITERNPKGSKNGTTLYVQVALQYAAAGSLSLGPPQGTPVGVPPPLPEAKIVPSPFGGPPPLPTAPRFPNPNANPAADPAAGDVQRLRAENDQLKRQLLEMKSQHSAFMERMQAEAAAQAARARGLAPNSANPLNPPSPEVEEINKQLRMLEIMEAESVAAAHKTRLERAMQLHKSGGLSQQELDLAKIEYAVAEIELQKRRAGNDVRAQAEAQVRIAETKAASARNDYERALALKKQSNSISVEEVELLELTLKRSEIAVQRARLELEAATRSRAPKP